jgi:hypothetical protein
MRPEDGVGVLSRPDQGDEMTSLPRRELFATKLFSASHAGRLRTVACFALCALLVGAYQRTLIGGSRVNSISRNPVRLR